MIFTKEELSEIFKSEVKNGIDDICVDSRNVKLGDLFVALNGENTDGHKFVKNALDQGANLALVEKEISDVDSSRLIKVKSSYQGLVDLAKYNLSKSKAKYIGVTGSIGKTTTKNLIYHLLSKFFGNKVYSSQKNFNSQIGLPICAAKMPHDTKFGIFEMGMSAKGEIKKLVDIVSPNISIISQICETHLEFFDCIWDIAKAKSEIMETKITQDATIIPADSAYTDFLKDKARNLGIKGIYTFGFSNSNAQIISVKRFQNKVEVQAEILGQKINYNINCNNESVIQNSLSAILAAHLISKIDLQDLANEIENFCDTDHRGKVFEKNGITIVDDSYNACFTSVRLAIQSLSKYPGKKILVIGDMKELGKNSIYFHENLSATIDKFGIDLVYACGSLSQYLFNNLQENKKGNWCENSQELAKEIIKNIKEDDKILVKGSHSMNMDKIVEAIKNVL